MKTAPDHPVFADHPITGSVTVGGKQMPTPYHVYEGHGTLITGSADAGAVDRAFDDQDAYPVLNRAGKAQLCLFVCRFDRASHGPHLEFQVTALAAATQGQTIPDAPEALLSALANRPDFSLLSLFLCNDTADVVAYNSNYLGLDAHCADGDVDVAPRRLRFQFQDSKGAPLVSGDVARNRRTGWRETWAFLRLIGPHAIANAARQPYASAHLMNRKGAVMAENRRARTLTAPDTMVVSRFDPARDRLDMQAPGLAAYGFRPKCIEHLSLFRFVYLHPDDSGPART